MPSNQCTNSLTELSFSIGNMIGAQECDVEDWGQLRLQLLAWECSARGKVGDALDNMKGTVTDAIAACKKGGCRADDCVSLFDNHEELLQSLNLYEPDHLGRGYRGGIPPKVKGAGTLQRNVSLAEQRTAEVTRIGQRKAAADQMVQDEAKRRLAQVAADKAKAAADQKLLDDAEKKGEPAVGRYNRMGAGDEERRKRWYPARV